MYYNFFIFYLFFAAIILKVYQDYF